MNWPAVRRRLFQISAVVSATPLFIVLIIWPWSYQRTWQSTIRLNYPSHLSLGFDHGLVYAGHVRCSPNPHYSPLVWRAGEEPEDVLWKQDAEADRVNQWRWAKFVEIVHSVHSPRINEYISDHYRPVKLLTN